jgi:riboflavin biosynthesis pyrimidine reductase
VHMLQAGPTIGDPLAPYAAVDRSREDERCWVMAHMVCGLDGSAAVGGRVGALSTAPDRELFLSMRALADVVLVGAETVRREGYGPVRLSAQQTSDRRSAARTDAPALAVVSHSLALDWAGRVFTDPAAESRTVSAYYLMCRSEYDLTCR